MYHENIEMLEFLRSVTPQWSYKHLQRLLYVAGKFDHMKSANWLHSIDAPWPDSFYLVSVDGFRAASECWHPDVVLWALDHGCSWGDWQCSKLNPDSYYCKASWTPYYRDEGHVYDEQYCQCSGHQCMKWNAIELFEWAHENGCPCTCAADAAAAEAAAAAADNENNQAE
jgi:hypothetical protein